METFSFHVLVPAAFPYRKLCHLREKNCNLIRFRKEGEIYEIDNGKESDIGRRHEGNPLHLISCVFFHECLEIKHASFIMYHF